MPTILQLMPFSIKSERTILSSREKVFQILTDVKDWNLWNPHIISTNTEVPIKEGSKPVIFPTRGAVKKMSVLKISKPDGLALRVPFFPGCIDIHYTLEEVSTSQTKITRTTHCRGPHGVSLYMLFGKTMRKDSDEVLQALQKEAELNLH